MEETVQRIAVCTQGVKLPGEVRGYTRFRKIAEVLAEAGFKVDLITSSFQHWEKAQRDTSSAQYRGLPYNIVFVEEPGYTKNLDLKRISSHARLARNLGRLFAASPGRYDLVYCEVPPNDCARVCAEAAKADGIPFVADINDLWPEAMRMAFNVPILSDIAFSGFARDAAKAYALLDAAVGTSDEYAARPAQDRSKPYEHITVYVGNDLAEFDAGVEDFAPEIEKYEDELWLAYAGMLGASYDLDTLIAAVVACSEHLPGIRLKLMGDGPDRERLEALVAELGAPVDFLGYLDYAHMAAWLSRCDIAVNSLVEAAPQSIVTKIGDYLAAGIPMINTGSSPEFRNKVLSDGFGINVPAENIVDLAAAIHSLVTNPELCAEMGKRARFIAETEFNQEKSYRAIVELIQHLLNEANEGGEYGHS